MDQLPMEIIFIIFQYLSKEEKIKVSKVNKKFREALFSPTLWTEDENKIEVPASQMKSFRKFLKQTPWLKYLNLQVNGTDDTRPSLVNLAWVFEPLKSLECVSLQLNLCKVSMALFPSTLNHISLDDRCFFIDNYMLIIIADSCPQLEHIQIKSYTFSFNYRKGLTYLLKKVNGTLQTLILIMPYYNNPASIFSHCPPNITTLCFHADFMNYIHDENPLQLPNLENLQILSLGDESALLMFHHIAQILVNSSLNNLRFLYLAGCYTLVREDAYTKFTKLPNLQVLYLDNCCIDFVDLERFIKGCSSLKALAWKAKEGYSKREIFDLEKLKKETPVRVYLSSAANGTKCKVMYFPTFPNEYFDCLKTFNHLFDEIFDKKSQNFSKCHAPFIKKCKALLGI